jgi:hypothetical protein
MLCPSQSIYSSQEHELFRKKSREIFAETLIVFGFRQTESMELMC